MSGDELAETAAGPPPASDRAPGAPPRAGDTVGRYVIERVLGAGGMGVVFAALDPDLDRRVALKVLRDAGADAPTEARARLLREARAMAKLSHPNVITVYEVGSAGATDFVAMELIDGHSASEWLATRPPPDDVLRVFVAAGRGLAAAHRAALVHRDFKPANVLVGRDGKVVVTDFGLARAFDEAAAPAAAASAPLAPTHVAGALDETLTAGGESTAPAAGLVGRADHGSLSSTLTRTGALLGTPAYMAPEQYLGASGPRADQFAYCVALWEALAGARPFRGQTFDELRRAIATATPQGEVPRALRPVLTRGLARDPERRFADMDALLAAIERTRGGRRRRLAAALAVGAIGAGALLLATGGERDAGAPGPATPAVCATGDAALATAWTPAIEARLRARLGAGEVARTALDGVAGRARDWSEAWARTCAAATDPAFDGRIACLLNARDELAAVTSYLETAPADDLRFPARALPAPADGCRTGRRPLLPPLPDDPAGREQIAGVQRAIAGATLHAQVGTDDEADELATAAVAAARAVTGYDAALAEALLAQAQLAKGRGRCDRAEDSFTEAALVANRAAADGLRAHALTGRLECLVGRTSDMSKIDDLVAEVEAALTRAGAAPVQRAVVEMIRAGTAAAQGDLDEAIARTTTAREIYEREGEPRRAVLALGEEASLLWMRNHPGDVDRSLAAGRRALDEARARFGADDKLTAGRQIALAWMLTFTHPDEARDLFRGLPVTAIRKRAELPTMEVSGRVVDAGGRPIAGASVAAGPMVLALADGEPIVAALGLFPAPAQTTTGADGRFELTAIKDSTVVAAAPDGRRTIPIAAKGGTLELRVRPTAAITIEPTVIPAPASTDPVLALAARLHPLVFGIHHATSAGYEQFAVPAGSAFTASGLPVDAPIQVIAVLRSALGDQILWSTRVVPTAGATVRVPITVDLGGNVLDVIVRGDRAAAIPAAQVVAVPGPLRRPPTRLKGLRELVADSPRVTAGNAAKVTDRTRTAAGAPKYRDDDIHSRLSAIRPGPTTVCVVPFAGDLADERFVTALMIAEDDDVEVRCQIVDVAATPAVQAIEIETPPMKRLKPPPAR